MSQIHYLPLTPGFFTILICLAGCAGLAAWLCWKHYIYVAIYGALLVFAVAVRSWVCRAQYWAGERKLRFADSQSSQNDFTLRNALGAKERTPVVT
jgi:hypothetical protein